VVLVACGGNSFSRDGDGNGGDGGTGLESGAAGTAPTGGAGTAAGGVTSTGGAGIVGGATATGGSAAVGGVTSGAAGVTGIGGSSAGMAGTGGDPGCEPMDARSNGDECAAIPGYAWDGSMCFPIVCGCEGSDCGGIYPTIDACDQARAACYASRGVRRDCTQHADCGASQRACCAPCGMPGAEAYIGIRLDSSPPWGQCGPIGCPDCLGFRDPAIYGMCLDGQCTVGDLGAAAACTTDTECRVRTKDCCECNSDTTPPALMAVGPGFGAAPPWCPNVGCPRCAPTPVPSNVTAVCDGMSDHCSLVLP
jgi:hypothetical protein